MWEFLEGIESISCLGIWQALPGLDFEPEVRELVSEGVAFWHIFLIQIAATHD